MTVAEPLDSVDPEIVGERLRIARKRRRLTQEAVARDLKLARTTLVAIEKGERRIRSEELVSLARMYGVQLHDLLRTSAPPSSLVPQLRLPDADADVQEQTEAAVADLEQLCDDYLELEELCGAPQARNYPAEYPMGSDIDVEAAQVARQERARLGLGDGPIHALRSVLESDVGLRVFMLDSLPYEVGGMYAYSERTGGVVAVNAGHARVRRRVSLAHEYAHFLTTRTRPEVTVEGKYARVPAHERFARAFAMEFLVPASGLMLRFKQLKSDKGGEVAVSDLVQLAHHYQVSLQVLIGRLEELRLVRRGLWELIDQDGFSMKEAVEVLGLQPPEDGNELLPVRFKSLAVESYRAQKLSEGRLAAMLRIDRIAARQLVAQMQLLGNVSTGEVDG